MTLPVAFAALAAARRIFVSLAVSPSSPALSLIQPAWTPVPAISSLSSPSIQSCRTSSLASCAQAGTHGSR
jgi:hypothetical protein